MAFTQDDINRLERALAEGVTRVRYADGREVSYRSLADMRSILQQIRSELTINKKRVNYYVSRHIR